MVQISDDMKKIIGAFYYQFCFLEIGGMLATYILYKLFFYTNYYWIVTLYIAYYSYSIRLCYYGGYYNSVRKWKIWEYFVSYFPMKLIKTADLDPKENYIFGMHPHGIMATSCCGNFCTEATGFPKLFPGLKAYVLTLEWLFFIPYTRELLLSMGANAAAKQTFTNILGTEEKGKVCVVVLGGASEALEGRLSDYKLILNSRKGFIRLAIQTGSQIVPVFTFGENNLYKTLPNPEGSFLKKFQVFIKKKTSLGCAIFWGRGFTEGSFGFFPLNKPTYTVVGKPIPVTKNLNPDKDEIDKLHQLYVEELIKLFEENKEKYDVKSATMEIM